MIGLLTSLNSNDHVKLGGCGLTRIIFFLQKLTAQLLLFIFLMATGMMTACAKEDSHTNKQSLLTKVVTAKQDIEKNYLHYNFKKDYKTAYQFTLMLPKTWKVDPNVTAQYPSNNNLKLLARVTESQKAQSAEVTVQSILLTNEIHPTDWLLHWLKSQQYHVLDFRSLPTQYGNIGDFLVSNKKKNQLSRLITIKDGNRIFLLIASTKVETYKQYEESFLLAIQSFQLINPLKELYAEPFRQEHIKKPYEVALRYPSSWEHRIEPKETKAVRSFSLINKKAGVILGHINIVILSDSLKLKADDALQTWVGKLKANKIQPEKATSAIKTKQLKDKKISTWQSNATRDEASLVLRSTIIEHKKGILMISLVSPSKARNHNAWAVNQRIYEILVNTATY